MRTSCESKKLIEALTVAERVTGRKESLPVLACVLIEATIDGTCVVRATNLDAGVEYSIPGKTEEVGCVAIAPQLLLQTLRASTGEHVSLMANERGLTVKTKSGTTTIKAVPHDEFPKIPSIEGAVSFEVPKEAIIAGITSVSYAASQSKIRPEFSSIFMAYKDGALVTVATDSFRLAERKNPVVIHGDVPEILLPVKNALEVVHTLERSQDSMVTIRVGDGQASFIIDGVHVMSRIVDASFPNYSAIIPKEFVTEIVVLKEDLAHTLRKARLFSHTTQQASFHIYPSKKVCTITARHADVGEMDDTIDGVMKGAELDIHFNIPYISDCFTSIASDSVSCMFAGPGKPLVIRGVSDPAFTYLVMPLNR